MPPTASTSHGTRSPAEDDRTRVSHLLAESTALLHTDTPLSLERAIEAGLLSERLGDEMSRGEALRLQGSCRTLLGEYEAALQSLQEAHDSFTAAGDPAKAGIMLTNIGIVHYYRGSYGTALEWLERSRGVCETTGNERHLPSLLNNIGNTFLALRDHDRALEHFEESLRRGRDTGNSGVVASVLMNIGTMRGDQGDYGAALESLNEALAIARDADHRHGMANALNNIGGTYLRLGEYERALSSYGECLRISEGIGDRRTIAFALNNIGDIHMLMGEVDSALPYLERSLALKEELGSRRDAVSTLLNLAAIRRGRGEFDLARSLCERGIEICTTSQEDQLRAESYRERGDIAMASEQYGDALDDLARAEEIVRRLDDRLSLVDVLVRTGECRARLADHDRARASLNEALAIADDLGAPPQRIAARRALADLHAARGEDREALIHYRRYHELERELFTQESDRRTRHLMIVLDLERAQQERVRAEDRAEILRLRNDQLEQEIAFKEKELAMSAMHLSQRSDLLRRIERRIRVIRDGSDADRALVDEITAEIVDAVGGTDAWSLFEVQFRQVHAGFLETLARLHPTLTPTELKVCALIKINLSTKEIAQILNTEPRSIEKYRQRIRKKLALAQEANLASTLLSIR